MIIETFDKSSKPIITVKDFYGEKKKICDICIITFSKEILKYAIKEFKAEKYTEIINCNFNIPIYIFKYNKMKIGIYVSSLGSAISGMNVIEANCLIGSSKFIMFGSAGSLNEERTRDRFIIPTYAYRDEGMSYHYAKPSDYIKTDQPRPIDTSEVTSSPTSSINGTNNDAHHHKSSSGLSVGAICAIAIPTIAALLGVAAAAALCKGGAVAPPVFTPPALPPPNYIDTSLEKFNVVHELPPQQPLPQVQPVHIEPQPLPQVVRPVYPINRVEPPLVNRAFEPMYNIQQPMQMVPVQQVQMVPVQQVEMVPVEEVVPVQQVFQPVEEHIQQYQQVRQVHQELIPERIETLPSITPADEGPIIQQTAETLPNLGPVNNFQLIQQTQESLPNIGPVNDALGQQGPSIGNSTGLGFSVQNLI